MYQVFLRLAAFITLLGILFGAFGAHGLRNILSPAAMEIYQTAVSYQMWHGLGLGLIASFSYQFPNSRLLNGAGWSMLVGIILFSGSLYSLSLTDIKWIGAITPVGGIALIFAWFLILVFAFRKAN